MVLIVDDDGCCASHTGHGSHIVVVVVAVSVVPSLLSFVVLLLLSSCTLRLIWRRKLFRSCSSAADAIAETRHITNRDESDLILFILLFFFCNCICNGEDGGSIARYFQFLSLKDPRRSTTIKNSSQGAYYSNTPLQT